MFLYCSAVSLPWSSSLHLSQYLSPLAIYMLSSRSTLLPYFLPYFPPSLLRIISYLTFCTSLKLHATFIIFLWAIQYTVGSTYPSSCLVICLSVWLSSYMSIWLPISLPISISDRPLIIKSLSRYLTVYLGICLHRRVDQQSLPSVSMPSIRAFRHIPFVS